jgi:hypothetical protein
MSLGDIAFFALMAVALVAAVAAQATLMTAREHVRAKHPDWFARLGAGGSAFRLGGPDERARRRLIRPLLLGRIPPEAAADEALARIAAGLRLALGVLATAFIGVILSIAARMPAG